MSEPVDEGLMVGAELGVKVVLGIGVADIGETMQHFGFPDYVVFICMLLLCVVVGLYFAFLHTAESAQDYLVGGRNMSVFPISMSLIASFISGISLLGVPTEIYVYGIQYMYVTVGVLVMALIMQHIYLPVFHNLTLTSTYEYLEKRFDRKTRIFASILFTIGMLTWLPVVIYVPALAFNQVTGVNVHLITPLVCVICIFYTSAGGIKAVVWTDVIQTVVMIGAMVLVAVKGTLNVGGVQNVWDRNWESNRIEGPNFDPSLMSRHTVWSLVFGGSIYWLQSAAVNQNMVQRYLALPSLKSANRALWSFVLGIYVLLGLCCYNGLLIFATYSECDPLTTTLAKEKDQLLPLLVMEVLGDFPGLPGLFVAGIFSAALSSLSTGLNSMAAVILEDFFKTYFQKPFTERQTYIIMKSSVVVMGCVFVGLVFVVEKLGAVLQLSMRIGAISAGPSLALFTMGILLPWVTANGALIGSVSGLVFMSWLCLTAQAAIAAGDLRFPEKPVTTDGCFYHFTPRETPNLHLRIHTYPNITDIPHTDEIFMLYRLSYLWYTIIGAVLSMAVAMIVSFSTKPLDPNDVDPNLLAPIVRRLIRPREYPNQPSSEEIIYAYGLPPVKMHLDETNVAMDNIKAPESA